MKTLLRGGFVVSGRGCRRADVLIDGEKVTDPKAVLTVDALNKGVVIKKGKKVYHKVTL